MATEASAKPDQIKVIVGNVIELCAAIGGFLLIAVNSFRGALSITERTVNNTIGLTLIGVAVFLYHKERTYEIRTGLIHGAFNAIMQVLQRESEQLPLMEEKDKVDVVTKSLERSQDKFFHLLKTFFQRSYDLTLLVQELPLVILNIFYYPVNNYLSYKISLSYC